MENKMSQSVPQTGTIVRAPVDDVAPPTVAPISAPVDSYAVGFVGMATEAFSAKAIEILRKPVDPDDVEIKPDGIVYLPGVFYRARLNEAFGPGAWAMPPRGPAKRQSKGGGEVVMFNGALHILGRFVSERIGQCMYYPNNRGMTYADAYEGAITDCLSRCCKDIIPGVEVLWNKGWREEWQARYAETFKGKEGIEWRRKHSSRTVKLSPNATPPTPPPGAGAAASVQNAAPGPSPSPAAPPVPVSAPTAKPADPPASDEQLDALEKLVFQDNGLDHDYAKRWIFTLFGTRDPGSLTTAQAETATRLMLFHGKEGTSPAYAMAYNDAKARGACN